MGLIDFEEETEELRKEKVRLSRKNELKRKIIMALIAVVVVLAIAFAFCMRGEISAKEKAQAEIEALNISMQKKDETIKKLEEEPMVVTPVSPKIDLELINSKIGDIQELATVEYLFTDAAQFTDSKQIKMWNVPFTEKSFIIRWEGIIKAGVDLKQVKIEADEENKKITVSIPASKILSYEIDNDSVEVIDEKDNIFNNISVNDKVQFDSKTEAEMKKRAIENGLLKKADENAKDILTRLIQSDPAVENDYTISLNKKG